MNETDLAHQETLHGTMTEFPSDAPPESGLAGGALVGQYELIRELGRGGMGQVFLARDVRLGRRVAIKVLAVRDPARIQRFLAEARATARCKHENIVTIHDIGQFGPSGDSPYMVLEYLEGITLRTWLKQQRELGEQAVSVTQAIEVLRPVLQALSHAHQLGLVHRDLKPANIMLTERGTIKVLDFGIAKVLAQSPEDIATGTHEAGAPSAGVLETHEGSILGTLPYMAPEQMGSGDTVDARTDLWAVGIMLWELAIGGHPLAPLSRERCLSVGDMDRPMPSARDARDDLGPLVAIIDRCLCKPKDERFESARSLLDELEQVLPQHGGGSGGADLPESPFAGLAAFQEQDAARFFGRERDVASILGHVRHSRIITITGPSGAGKSSLVRAGMIPALKRTGQHWEAIVTRPGRHPIRALAGIMADMTMSTGQKSGAFAVLGARTDLAATLKEQPGFLGVALRARCLHRQSRVLLFIDQFEELYTLSADRDIRRTFVQCLEGVADDASSPLRVVLSLRSDYLDRVAEDRNFTDELTRDLVLLAPMDRDGLRQALIRPVEAAGYAFEGDDMVESMLDELTAARSPLPLMQFAAQALWSRRDHKRCLLTRASYDELGGIGGILARHADRALAALSADERILTRAIFERLVTPERTRAIVNTDELHALAEHPQTMERILQHLADTRLIVVEGHGDSDGASVEIVHESLISGWPTLRRWLGESEGDAAFLARLRGAAQQWHTGGQVAGMLWSGDALRRYETWRARNASTLTRTEEAFVRASQRTARRRSLRRRAVVGAALAGLVIALVIFIQLNRRADTERRRAQVFASESSAHALEAAAHAAESRARLLELYEEYGRLAVLSGDGLRAFTYLREAIATGGPGAGRLFMMARVTDSLDDLQLVLPAHDSVVFAAAFSPDGRWLVTGGHKQVRLWRADTGALVHELPGHGDKVWSARFSPDGRDLLTSSFDGTARLWRVDSGELRWLVRHEGQVRWSDFNRDGSLVGTASADDTFVLWERESGTARTRLLHKDRVVTAAFSHDGTRIATGTSGGDVEIWRLADGQRVLGGQPEHKLHILHLAFSPDDGLLATASRDEVALIIDPSGRRPTLRLPHEHWVTRVRFARDGSRLVTGSQDQKARIWDTRTGRMVLALTGHTAGITDVHITPDDRRIITVSRDATARAWDARTGAHLWSYIGHGNGLWTADINADGTRLLTASFDGHAWVWDATRAPHALALPDMERTDQAEFNPDGTLIATVSRRDAPFGMYLRIWRTSGEMVAEWQTDTDTRADHLLRVSWHPAGDRLLIAGDAKAIEWSLATRTAGNRFGEHEGEHSAWTHHAVYYDGGERIATAGADNTIKLWDAREARHIASLTGHSKPVVALAVEHAGEHLLSAGADKTARMWHLGQMRQVRTFPDNLPVNEARFSRDDRFVVTASEDHKARIWTRDGQLVRTLEGHATVVVSIDVSADGQLVATGSSDRTMKVWSMATGVPLWSSPQGSDEVTSVRFSPDASWLLSSQGGAVRAWATNYERRSVTELEQFARCRVGYVLRQGRLERAERDHAACNQ